MPKHSAAAPATSVAAALASLSDADLLRLKRFAQFRSLRLPLLDWSDLLNEAVARVLDGSRRWPSDLDFVVFMRQSIRSIASEHWRGRQRSPVVTEAEMPDDGLIGESSWLNVAARPALHPEREVLAQMALNDVASVFAGDAAALAVLRGLAEGDSAAEIQRQAGLTENQYASTQKRIRRRLGRAFPAGGALP
jgi:RNA polymerase sigma-70 factor (ECF subfamily)